MGTTRGSKAKAPGMGQRKQLGLGHGHKYLHKVEQYQGPYSSA